MEKTIQTSYLTNFLTKCQYWQKNEGWSNAQDRSRIQFLIFSYGPLLISDAGKTCLTPNNQPGECIYLRNCEALQDIMRLGSGMSENQKSFLQKSSCNIKNDRNPEVCCLKSSDVKANHGKTISNRNLAKTIDSNELLPKVCGQIGHYSRFNSGNRVKLGQFPWIALLEYNTCKLKFNRTPVHDI